MKDISKSIKAKLLNRARSDNRPFNDILHYYTMERFLYRLAESEYSKKFILKGALLFFAWNVPERRTTMDIDFGARFDNKVQTIENVIKDLCCIKVIDDGLIFDSGSVTGESIRVETEYKGVRVKFKCFLEKAIIDMQVDVGFGDTFYPAPKLIEYPTLIDLPRPKIKGCAQETVISEKFEAMVSHGSINSRMKDFYDIWLMIRQFELKGTNIANAIKKTFNNRKTELPETKSFFADEIYDEKSDRQILWKAFLEKGGIERAPKTLAMTAKEIEDFLFEPIMAIKKNNKFDKKWKPLIGWE